MNDSARTRQLALARRAALLAAALLSAAALAPRARAEAPTTVQGPINNINSSTNGMYNYNPNQPGQQLILGAPTAPTTPSRPAGWPGGTSEDDPPPKTKKRKRPGALQPRGATAAPVPGSASPSTMPQSTMPQNSLPQSPVRPGAAMPAAAANFSPTSPASPGVVNAIYTSTNPRPMVGGIQQVGTAADDAAFGGGYGNYNGPAGTLPISGPPNQAGGAAPASNTPSANTTPGALPYGTPQAAPRGAPATRPALPAEMVASRMPSPVEFPVEEKIQNLVPFGLPATFSGAEIIAWVGPEVVLASDVLPDANRTVQRMLERKMAQKPEPEDIERARKAFMAKLLERTIETKLVIVEGRRTLPKEAWPKIEKQFNEQFDKEYLGKMMEAEEVNSRTELDIKLRKSGSSLVALKRQAMENSFAAHWLEEKVKDDREITHEEMHAYYREHIADYETPARARWEHLMVRFDKFDTKEAAWQAIAGWGCEIQKGAKFTDVATAHSQDVSASDGGVHTWTNKNALVSEVLDSALFTLPVGELSPILEDKRGFHIIRVIERDDLNVTPFTDTQTEIRKKIRDQRTEDKRTEYKNNLRKKIPVWNIFEQAAGTDETAVR
ncbi:MAG TPA: peptidyl-prolyl cis-trans isomerase [Pirellulales bacterium]|nr:peptidyl-prolyl cis-trans isomerase [Pirellulales bacterium]